MKISHNLKMKIISNYKHVNIEQHHNEIDIFGQKIMLPLYKEIEMSLNLINDLDLFKECIRWYESIRYNYKQAKVNIGYFIGLIPVEINKDYIVFFTADEFNHNNQNWKDWFIMEKENAPI